MRPLVLGQVSMLHDVTAQHLSVQLVTSRWSQPFVLEPSGFHPSVLTGRATSKLCAASALLLPLRTKATSIKKKHRVNHRRRHLAAVDMHAYFVPARVSPSRTLRDVET